MCGWRSLVGGAYRGGGDGEDGGRKVELWLSRHLNTARSVRDLSVQFGRSDCLTTTTNLSNDSPLCRSTYSSFFCNFCASSLCSLKTATGLLRQRLEKFVSKMARKYHFDPNLKRILSSRVWGSASSTKQKKKRVTPCIAQQLI